MDTRAKTAARVRRAQAQVAFYSQVQQQDGTPGSMKRKAGAPLMYDRNTGHHTLVPAAMRRPHTTVARAKHRNSRAAAGACVCYRARV